MRTAENTLPGQAQPIRVYHHSQSANLIFRAELLEKPIKEKRKSQWSWQFFERTVSLSDAVRERLLAGEPVDIVLTSKVCKIN